MLIERDYTHWNGLYSLKGTILIERDYTHWKGLYSLKGTILIERDYAHWRGLAVLTCDDKFMEIYWAENKHSALIIRKIKLLKIKVIFPTDENITIYKTNSNIYCRLLLKSKASYFDDQLKAAKFDITKLSQCYVYVIIYFWDEIRYQISYTWSSSVIYHWAHLITNLCKWYSQMYLIGLWSLYNNYVLFKLY